MQRHLRLVALATLLLSSSVIAACGTSSPDTGADGPTTVVLNPTTTATTTTIDQLAVGGASPTLPQIAVPESLQFSAPLVGGGVFDGSAYVGQPLAFWFWAPT